MRVCDVCKKGLFDQEENLCQSCYELKVIKNTVCPTVDWFSPKMIIGKHLFIDEKNKCFKIAQIKNKLSFSSLINFEVVEDGDIITKGGLGKAIAGGVLFGGIGAVIGGVTANKKSQSMVSHLYIRISLNDIAVKHAQIDIITPYLKTKKDSSFYRSCKKQVDEIISALEFIINQQQVNTQPPIEQLSAADEIMKYKRLLDCGAITEIEYQSKKDKLLE